MPDFYWNTCKNLVNRANESAGFMVYGKKDTGLIDVLNVFYLTYNEFNNPSTVQIDPEKRQLLNEFLQGQNDYGYIDFHTHTNETIRRHGHYYNHNFSNTDIDDISQGLAGDVNYIHILFTPDTHVKFSNETMQDSELEIMLYSLRDNDFVDEFTEKYDLLNQYFNL